MIFGLLPSNYLYFVSIEVFIQDALRKGKYIGNYYKEKVENLSINSEIRITFVTCSV